MTDDNCGWPTAEGHGCKHPATEENGRCWQHCEDARKGGRPTKFTDERARQAIEAAREFKSLTGCGRAAGVHRDTIKNWLLENPEYETNAGEYEEFFAGFMQARAEAESVLARGPLTRPDEVDGQHARFLLKTSFNYQEIDRLEIEDTTEQDREDTVAELESLFE